MKKTLSSSLFLALFLVITASALSNESKLTFPFIGKINSNMVNIRSGPHINFEILGKAERTQELVVLEKQQNWYKIKLPDYVSVYINSKFIEKRSESVGMVNANRVNIRAKPDIKSNIISQANKGVVVGIRQQKNEWLAIEPTSGCIGWVSAEFIEYLKPFSEQEERKLSAKQKIILSSPKQESKILQDQLPVAKGIIEDSGILLAKKALYKLLDGKGELLYYLDADKKLLDNFSTFKVAVWGEVVNLKAYNRPIIKVQKILVTE
jgi:SH3-like domain-containing protein